MQFAFMGLDPSTLLLLTGALTFAIGAFGGYVAGRLRISETELYKLQFRKVRGASFQRQKLMNASEFRVFRTLEQDTAIRSSGYRLVAQPSLGEIVTSANKFAFSAINSKRVDMLIIDKGGWPLLAIEYQGEGHYDDTAEIRDAIKKEALQRANVGYVEIFPNDSAEKILEIVHKGLGWAAPFPGPAKDTQNRIQAALR